VVRDRRLRRLTRSRPTTSASSAAATVKPSQPVAGRATPSPPPATQASCSQVSERANADARWASGTSRCTIASRAALPSALATAATPATSAAIGRLKKKAATTVTTAAAPAATRTTTSGLAVCIREPIAVPSRLPAPAAAAIEPSAIVAGHPPDTVAWTRNAEKMVRNPPRPRSAAVARSAVTTCRVVERRRPGASIGTVRSTSTGSSPAATSTCAGSRTARTAAAVNSAAVAPSSQPKPSSAATPAASPPHTPPAARPNTESRALADVSDMAAGSTRGTTDPRSTLNPLLSTSTPSAAAYSARPSWWTAITTASTARPARLPASAQRRPRCSRSSAGPITGATTANGAIVTSR
jgi:hypothetical protein